MRMTNPFTYGTVVTGEDFANREDPSERIQILY